MPLGNLWKTPRRMLMVAPGKLKQHATNSTLLTFQHAARGGVLFPFRYCRDVRLFSGAVGWSLLGE